jgi:hypothetical protein
VALESRFNGLDQRSIGIRVSPTDAALLDVDESTWMK